MYGKIVDAYGNTVVADADADMSVRVAANLFPRDDFFMRFNGLTNCMPGICRVIRRRTAAFACPSNTRLHSLIRQCRDASDGIWQDTDWTLSRPIAALVRAEAADSQRPRFGPRFVHRRRPWWP